MDTMARESDKQAMKSPFPGVNLYIEAYREK
jgi:hypothetical protein